MIKRNNFSDLLVVASVRLGRNFFSPLRLRLSQLLNAQDINYQPRVRGERALRQRTALFRFLPHDKWRSRVRGWAPEGEEEEETSLTKKAEINSC